MPKYVKEMPASMRKKWESKKIVDTILVFMKYWNLSHDEVMKVPIPAYFDMMRFMEEDFKQRKKQEMEQKRKARSKGRKR